jgi:hypothetical protein
MQQNIHATYSYYRIRPDLVYIYKTTSCNNPEDDSLVQELN